MERWTREAIIFAIRRWANDYGEPPLSTDWATNARPVGFPSRTQVKTVFGTWNAAIKAAGFQPRSRGAAGHIDPEWTRERFAGAGRSR